MKIWEYILRKQKAYLGTTAVVFLIGVIFIFWGLDVNNETVKNAVLVSVGTSLIASGIVASLDLLRTFKRDQLNSRFDSVFVNAGIENAYAKRDLDEYDTLIKNAKKSIDIMGYSLRGFYQSYRDILLEKTEKNSNFTIRILVVTSDSISSKWREANEDGKSKGVYKESIETLKRGFKDRPNIEIKMIDIPLGHMIYRIDDIMYIGPYLYKKNSKSTNTVRLCKDGWLFKEYQQEFNAMWKDAGDA